MGTSGLKVLRRLARVSFKASDVFFHRASQKTYGMCGFGEYSGFEGYPVWAEPFAK
jgi:hypothetical protein